MWLPSGFFLVLNTYPTAETLTEGIKGSFVSFQPDMTFAEVNFFLPCDTQSNTQCRRKWRKIFSVGVLQIWIQSYENSKQITAFAGAFTLPTFRKNRNGVWEHKRLSVAVSIKESPTRRKWKKRHGTTQKRNVGHLHSTFSRSQPPKQERKKESERERGSKRGRERRRERETDWQQFQIFPFLCLFLPLPEKKERERERQTDRQTGNSFRSLHKYLFLPLPIFARARTRRTMLTFV